LRLLGEGGMGQVYEAFDPELNRKVALKVVRSAILNESAVHERDRWRTNFMTEARNLARFSHPNVVPIFDVGALEDGGVYLAMELVLGETLRQRMRRAALPWREALEIMLQAGEGLAAAHAAGLLHLDFKPDNVMVGHDGQVRVLDFGLARDLAKPPTVIPIPPVDTGVDATIESPADATLLAADQRNGTPAYMAPEVLVGRTPSAATDIFAWSCVAYEIASKSLPFPSDPAQRLQAIFEAKLRWPRHVPAPIRALAGCGLAYNPANRPQNLAAMLAEIRRTVLQRDRRRISLLWMVAALLPIAALAASYQHTHAPQDPDCVDQGQALASTWNAHVREAAAEGFARTHLLLAGSLWQGIETRVDAWQDDWTAGRSHLCADKRAELGLEPLPLMVREQMRSCLDESRAEMGALLEIWKAPSQKQVLESGAALDALTRPGDCTDLTKLSDRAPLPIDPILRRQVLDFRTALSGLRALANQSENERVESWSKEHTQDIYATGDWPLIAEFSALKTVDERSYSDKAGYISARAVLSAIAANRSHLASFAESQLWSKQIYYSSGQADGAESLRTVSARTLRAGSLPMLLQNRERVFGIWASMHGEFASALPHFERAVGLAIASHGLETSASIAALDDLGYTLMLAADYERAQRVYQTSIDVAHRIMPPGHFRRARLAALCADICMRTGDLLAAMRHLVDGTNECPASGLPPDRCTEARKELARTQLATGAWSNALELAMEARAYEATLGHRLRALEPTLDNLVSLILVNRGETKPALELAQMAVDKVLAERNAHPMAPIIALNGLAEVAIEASLFERAAAALDRAQDFLHHQFDSTGSEICDHWRIRANLAIARGDFEQSIASSERALAAPGAWALSPQEYAPILLGYAQGLLGIGEFALARNYAEVALATYQRTRGLLPHMTVLYHEVLAEIALADRRYGDALLELEFARLIFDDVEVLSHRKASLDLLEARIWQALDRSAQGRQMTLELARSALRQFSDRDLGGELMVAKVRDFMRAIRLKPPGS
jgi:serine/threonine-protein kinase